MGDIVKQYGILTKFDGKGQGVSFIMVESKKYECNKQMYSGYSEILEPVLVDMRDSSGCCLQYFFFGKVLSDEIRSDS